MRNATPARATVAYTQRVYTRLLLQRQRLLLLHGEKRQSRSCAGGAGRRYPFLTSKECDVETGLDYFEARYYSATQGRFTSPDEFVGGPDELFYFAQDAAENPTFYAELANPQSLNKYQYCLNNPLRYIDPDGHQQQDGKSSNIVDRIIKSANEILGSLFASLQRAAGKDGAPEEERRPGPYGNKIR